MIGQQARVRRGRVFCLRLRDRRPRTIARFRSTSVAVGIFAA